MGKAREVEIQVGVYENEFSIVNPTEDELELKIEKLSLVHVFSTEDNNFPMRVIFYRKIPMVDGCSITSRCVCYGETCESIYLPPGDYEYTICDDGAAKYLPDEVFTISLVIEEPSHDFVLAEQLNANC